MHAKSTNPHIGSVRASLPRPVESMLAVVKDAQNGEVTALRLIADRRPRHAVEAPVAETRLPYAPRLQRKVLSKGVAWPFVQSRRPDAMPLDAITDSRAAQRSPSDCLDNCLKGDVWRR